MYRIERELHRGAHAIVYQAKHEKLDQPVAIKVLQERLEEESPRREAYSQLAQTLSQLEHTNLVRVSDFGIADNAPYLVMELLSGETLAQRMSAGPLAALVSEEIMHAVLRAAGHMHMRGVVHGELNPSQVFLHDDAEGGETVKLLGLGRQGIAANSNVGDSTLPRLPVSDINTAPEQVAGKQADARSDVFAAAVLMLQLAGRALPSLDELKEDLSLSSEVRVFLVRALARDPRERFGNADQMLKAMLELPTPWFESAGQPGADSSAPEPEPVELDSDELEPVEEEAPAKQAAASAGSGENQRALELSTELAGSGKPAPPRTSKRKLLLKLGAAGVLALALAGGAFAWWRLQHAPPPSAAGPMAHVADKAHATPEHEGEAAKEAEEPEPSAPAGTHEVKPAEEPQAGPAAQAPPDTTTSAAAPEQPHTSDEFGKIPAPAPAAHGGGEEHAHAKAEPAAPAPPQAPAPTKVEPAVAPAAPGGAEHVPSAPPPPAQPDSAKHPPPAHAGEAQEKAEPAAQKPKAAPQPAAPAQHAAPAPRAAPAPVEPPPPAASAPKPRPAVRYVKPTEAELRQMVMLAAGYDKPRSSPRDPWSGSLPPGLKLLQEAVTAGAKGSDRAIAALRAFNLENPELPHGHLLLAGIYANRKWPLDALDEYRVALMIDPSSRGDPAMLSITLSMVARDRAAAEAARFIERTYGAEAVISIDNALRKPTIKPEASARLKALRTRIVSGGRR